MELGWDAIGWNGMGQDKDGMGQGWDGMGFEGKKERKREKVEIRNANKSASKC